MRSASIPHEVFPSVAVRTPRAFGKAPLCTPIADEIADEEADSEPDYEPLDGT